MRVLNNISYRLIALTIFSLGSMICKAQNGTIKGLILSNDKRSIEQANVGLLGTSIGTVTNSRGEFIIKNVKPGKYTIQATFIGFLSSSALVDVQENQVLTVNLQLNTATKQLNEVIITGTSEAKQLASSSKAVVVIDTKEIKLKSGDLSQVMSQVQGVNIRRSGGLGSDARFSLNGLTDDQIRFFVDGIPLAFTGYSFGFSNIPINLVERVEIYKGVVPVSFGADALGGAVNIVTRSPKSGLHSSVSYQTGSFGTHRASASVDYVNDSTGLVVGANGFYDHADNNYNINVDAPNDKGKLENITVRRFHDAYDAKGANITVGLKNRRWAKYVGVNLVATEFSKELQNNNVMTIPYGAVEYGRNTLGSTFRYNQTIAKKLSIDVLAGYSHNTITYVDTTTAIYDWHGNIVGRRLSTAELGSPADQIQWEKNAFTRINFDYQLNENQKIKLSLSPSRVTRTGRSNRLLDPNGRDPLAINQELKTLINGIEHEINGDEERLQNVLFAKQYIQVIHSGEYIAGGTFREKNQSSTNYGMGDGFRYAFGDRIITKASYEWAARLPRTDEVFGDGALVLPNLDLKPERSHNGNVEIVFNQGRSAATKWNVGVTGFVRAAKNLITVLGSDKVFAYFNVAQATSSGAELAGRWTSSKDRFTIHANATYVDFRNHSTQGTYSYYQGDRIPNRPYLFGNTGAQYNFTNLAKDNDLLTLFWSAQYVHKFYRNWESAGIKEYKQVIPSQFVNNGGVTYKFPFHKITSALSMEVQNVTNAKVYDNFGVQKPGRAFYIKLTCQL